MQPWQFDSQKTRNTTRLKCCACHATWTWTRPKCCTCHEKWKASSENDAKVLRLSHKWLWTRYETCLNVTKCHACHAKRGYATFETFKSDHFFRTRHIGTAILTRTAAKGCGRKHNIERTHPQPPDPQSETGTLPTHPGNTEPHYGEVGHLRGRAALNIFESPWSFCYFLLIFKLSRSQFLHAEVYLASRVTGA